MDTIKAVVEKVITGGKHGPYAIATHDGFEGSVTFSLEPTVWQEKDRPEPGSVVHLSSITQKRAGWRAKKGRYWNPSDEQTAKTEQALTKWAATLKRISGQFFPTKEDKVWKQWVDFKDREEKDLVELLSSDIKDNFKRRALFLLLVPSADFNMLYWKKDIGRFYHGADFVEKLTVDQLDYVTDLITGFCSVLKPMHCDRPKNVVEGGGGVTIFMSIPDKYHNALYFYNNCILHLLALLPEEKAAVVFPFFSLIDISTYSNMEDSSGYNPFQSLLYSEKIDEKWKVKADARMREIISNEITGKAKPREDWEEAMRQYADIIQMMLYGNINYSRELYASQAQFIMDNRQDRNNLINSWHVIRFLGFLSGDEYKKLRHIIARYVLLEDVGQFSKFSIYDKATQEAVDCILEEFPDDLELIDRIRELERERDQRSAENKVHQSKKEKTEDEILAQMRL